MNAAHDTAFGFTWMRRAATGTRKRSAKARYRSNTRTTPRMSSRRTQVRGPSSSLENLEDRLRSLLRSEVGRVDLEHEREPCDRLLEDHVDRFRLHVLPDLLAGPPPRLEPLSQYGRFATEDDGHPDVHVMAIVSLEERDFRRYLESIPEGVDVDLVAPSHLISSGDQSFVPRHIVQIDDEVAATRQHRANRSFPRSRGSCDCNKHGRENRGRVIKGCQARRYL